MSEPIYIELELRGPLAERVRRQADKSGTTPVELMADIIETVIEDDLFAAVLDT